MPRSLVVLAALAFGAVAHGQSGTVRGKIADSAGAPIAGAVVTVDNTTLRATTTADGRYAIRGVPAGDHTLRVRMIRYTPMTKKITVGAGAEVDQDFTLVHSTQVLAPVDVVAGSRAEHTAANELPVPVDIYGPEVINKQGSTETGQVLATLSPSVNFPHQSITDANDIVRPYTLRGLSPDETLTLVNGWRVHQSALVNTFPYGSAAGSSGSDMNTIPSSAIDNIEVLRDGASTEYGSDAVAGVVNVKMKDGTVSPFLNVTGGEYVTGKGYANDGGTYDINGGVGVLTGRGSLGLFGEYQQRGITNRAWADPTLTNQQGVADSIDPNTGQIIQKRNGIPQPNYHWGDGLEQDAMFFANWRQPVGMNGAEWYAFANYSHRVGTGQGFYRYWDSARNWPEIYPNGFLPEFHPIVQDGALTAGYRANWGGWNSDLGASFGENDFNYRLQNTLNPSLGPSLTTPTAPGADGILGTADDPGIPNQLNFNAGTLRRMLTIVQFNTSKPIDMGLHGPTNLALGASYQYERWQTIAGEYASWVNGGHLAQDSVANPGDLAPAGSSVFGGFSPTDASDNYRSNVGVYADLEGNLSEDWLANVALRYEHYSDFGSALTWKAAARWQPAREFIARAALSTGFRAPGLSQNFFSHTTTNFIGGQLVEIGNYPVTNPAAQLFGAAPLKEETSFNASGGVAWSPTPNVTFTADLYYITINNRILLGATFDGTQDTVVARVLNDAGYTNISGVQFFINGLNTRTTGLTLTGNWTVTASRAIWNFNLAVNYAKNEITKYPPLPAVLQGTATTYTSSVDLVTQLALTKEAPMWRGIFTTTFTQGRWHGLGRASYYGSITSAEPSFTDAETYAPRTLIDLEAGYQFEQFDLSLGVRNLFNIYPGRMFNVNNNNVNTLPWAAASPFGYDGRYVYARASVALVH